MLCQYKFTQNNFIIKFLSILDFFYKKKIIFLKRFKKSYSEQWVFIICQQLHFLNYATSTQISSKPLLLYIFVLIPFSCMYRRKVPFIRLSKKIHQNKKMGGKEKVKT